MSQDSIPQGMDPTVWASLTPEQRQAYTNPPSDGVDYQAQAEAHKDAAIKQVKKQLWYSVIFAAIGGVFSALFGGLFGGGGSK